MNPPSAAPVVLLLAWACCFPPTLSASPAEASAPPADAAAATAEAPAEEPEDRAEPADPETPDEPATLLSDQIVVSAERLPVPEAEVGSSVTVIDRDEIELRGETTVLELLRTVPGLEVVQAGGPGGVASVFLRGASSEHTLVLLDGVRLNPASGGGFDFAGLSTTNVERIEVLRGPQSTLYGSEAMGGVVSITTRRGAGPAAGEVDARAGSFDTRRLALTAAAGRGAFDYSVGASVLETDAVSAASERLGNRETDPFESVSASARLGWGFAADSRADLTVRWSDTEANLDGFAFGVGPVDDPNFVQDRRLGQAALSAETRLADGWRATARLGTARTDTEGRDPDSPFNDFAFDSRLDTAELHVDADRGAAGRTTAGYDFERRRASNRGAFDEQADLHSLFVLHRWAWRDRLHLTAGARHDDYSETGGETTWRLTGAWIAPRGDGRLHGSYGTGFRVPSFTELFFPGAGNPELSPEASEGWDLGWEQGFAGGRAAVDVTAFRNRFDDLILFDFTSARFANVAEAEAEGVEATVAVHPRDPLEVRASWTWTDSDDGTGDRLARRPEHRGTLELSYAPAGGWHGSLVVVAVADRVDSDGTPMDDYERLDLRLETPALGRWRPYLRVDNLLDERYEEVPGFTTPGFAAYGGARVAF